MSRRLVIPANDTSSTLAFQGMTWQQIADANGCDSIELLGSTWCVANGIDGLGIATEAPPIPDPVDPPVTVEARIAAAQAVLAEAAELDPQLPADLADILTRTAEALGAQ